MSGARLKNPDVMALKKLLSINMSTARYSGTTKVKIFNP